MFDLLGVDDTPGPCNFIANNMYCAAHSSPTQRLMDGTVKCLSPAACLSCQEMAAGTVTFGPSHYGSRYCRSGALASGGLNTHCSCSVCF
jgi:hypothetical protein